MEKVILGILVRIVGGADDVERRRLAEELADCQRRAAVAENWVRQLEAVLADQKHQQVRPRRLWNGRPRLSILT